MNFKGLTNYLTESGIASKDLHLVFASGELTIHPHLDELLDIGEKYPVIACSTGALFNERLASLVARPGSHLDISLDCGTRETYKTVKGVDFFDRVVANIRKYRERNGYITLKYIVLPENSNDGDVDSFIKLAADNEVLSVFISRDVKKNVGAVDSKILRTANRLFNKAKENNISVSIVPYFTEEQLQIIEGCPVD